MRNHSASAPPFDALDMLPPRADRRTLARVYRAAVETGLPVALWRYPHGHEPHALVDFSGQAQAAKIDFTRQTPGFAFAPFVNRGGQATLFLKAGLHLDGTGHHLYAAESASWPETENRARFLERYRRDDAPAVGQTWFTAPESAPDALCTEAEFCALVEEAIAYIRATGIQKIVASRAAEVPLPPRFDPVATFQALCRRYRHAFISLVAIPGVGTWMGASPELLLSMDDTRLRTVALAGTRPRPADAPLDTTPWGQKEIEEQALVSDYIRAFFQNLGLRNFTEDGPHTVSAGSIVHLQTRFTIRLPYPRLLRLANRILDDLHPTSAVCGMPKREALSFILEKERYHRAFYSGFLGPVHLNGESRLFVNLRCMQLLADRARLYIGAGITRDSIPRAEWRETVLKANTLLSVL